MHLYRIYLFLAMAAGLAFAGVVMAGDGAMPKNDRERTATAGVAAVQSDYVLQTTRQHELSTRGGSRPTQASYQSHDDVMLVSSASVIPTATPSPTSTPTPSPTPAFNLQDLGTFKVTAYSDSPYLNGTDGRGITRSGERTRWGVVAVDPAVIPLRSRLIIDGFEGTVFDALDTGGGIKGNWIDIWYPTDEEALEHGVKYLKVRLLLPDRAS
jgi:3D (Asp-Asp-Asp) domain-containing protein